MRSIARRGQGYGIPGIQVDGNDVLAVLAATRLALARASSGQGPTLIEAVTYRMGPHTTSDDPTRYRSRDEEEEWRAKDPLTRLRRSCGRGPLRRGVRGDGHRSGGRPGVRDARGVPRHGRPGPSSLFDHVYAGTHPLLEEERLAFEEYQAGFDGVRATCATSTARPKPCRSARRSTPGCGGPWNATPRSSCWGRTSGSSAACSASPRGCSSTSVTDRVIDTPLAESGVIGTAVGLAIRGFRPVCEIQFDGFVYPAFDQIVSQVAKLRYRNQGRVAMPLTIRIPFGGGIGAVEHHSESPEAYFAHTAGLRVVACSNPADAYRMIQQAVASDDPVVFFEPKRRYWDKGDVDVSEPPDAVPLHQARIVAEGNDVTVATYGPLVSTALDAARDAAEEGTSVEVVDLRSLSPLDFATLEASVRKTGRLVVVHEAPVFCGFGAEVAARVSERCFYHLEAPVVRVGGYDTPYPASKLESFYLPDADRILDAVDRTLEPTGP